MVEVLAAEIPAYRDLIAGKARRQTDAGFDPGELPACLLDFQRIIVARALRRGRYAMFADCGMGKTLMQLVWAQAVVQHTAAPVLILAPLAVASQTVAEGAKFGIEVRHLRTVEDYDGAQIYVTNYDRLDNVLRLLPELVQGIVLDESSILKSFMGKTKRRIVEAFAATPYRLACTATPSPNDFVELGNHAEFLGVMPANEMLMRWFINDTMNFGTWRLKGHATDDFWRWVGSWATCIGKPSDIPGCSDDGFVLPPHEIINHAVEVDVVSIAGEGEIFRRPGTSATQVHAEARTTLVARCAAAAALVNGSPEEPFVVWCNLNEEADELQRLIPGAVEVRGSHTLESKERNLAAFSLGQVRVIITKPSVAGYGMNWQHCARAVCVGLTYSFEDLYQACRRTWRFGQRRPVKTYIVSTVQDARVLETINRKMADHQAMRDAMALIAGEADEARTDHLTDAPLVTSQQEERWNLYLGDCVEVAGGMPADSIGYSVFSPPFANLYIYSDSARDMGNCSDDEEFLASYRFLVRELLRITKPGRLCSVHCKQLVDYKGRDGRAGMRDFRGELIRIHEAEGWKYHSEVTIWKDPVIEMQRTKAHGLLYKQLRADSSFSRQGMAEYVVTFRKWAAEDEVIDPVTHDEESFPLGEWQKVASPVWMDIRQTNVLNVQVAREDKDEKHLCPLQLDVIERCIRLWSNPNDLVFSPFTGIGSEGVVALRMGRRFVGTELKAAYFQQAIANLKGADLEATGQLRIDGVA